MESGGWGPRLLGPGVGPEGGDRARVGEEEADQGCRELGPKEQVQVKAGAQGPVWLGGGHLRGSEGSPVALAIPWPCQSRWDPGGRLVLSRGLGDHDVIQGNRQKPDS